MTAPKSLVDLFGESKKMSTLDETYMLKLELKRIKEANVQKNLEREMKKLALKKVSILEKEYLFNQKMSQSKLEKEVIEKCKLQAQNQAMINKETKL